MLRSGHIFCMFPVPSNLCIGKIFQFFLMRENINVKGRIKACYESTGISNHVIKLSVSLGKVRSVITFPKVSSDVLKSPYLEEI